MDFTRARYNQDFSKLTSRFLLGPPKAIVDRMADYVKAGVSMFVLEFACSPERAHDQLVWCAEEVLPLAKEIQ
jgi:hypothetical protein